MKDSARYVKIVEWSDEDQCYVGSAPGLVYGGCHGLDERAVFAELCEIVEDAIALYKSDGRPATSSNFRPRSRQQATARRLVAHEALVFDR